MKRIIKKVAVLGSGVMGSRIASHFAGVGLQVLLLDIAAKEGDKNTGLHTGGGQKNNYREL
jgi:3-hydroxyacyl-CoA dehydrogenase